MNEHNKYINIERGIHGKYIKGSREDIKLIEKKKTPKVFFPLFFFCLVVLVSYTKVTKSTSVRGMDLLHNFFLVLFVGSTTA
jgi:hypothetical protein